MNTRKTISEQALRQTVAEFVYREPKDIGATDHFEDDLGLDSIDRIDLLTEVEKRHDVAFSDEQIVAIMNLHQLVETLTEKPDEA